MATGEISLEIYFQKIRKRLPLCGRRWPQESEAPTARSSHPKHCASEAAYRPRTSSPVRDGKPEGCSPHPHCALCGGETLWLLSWLIFLHVHAFLNYTCGSYLKVGGPGGCRGREQWYASHSQLALHLQTRDSIPLTGPAVTMGLPQNTLL